MLFSRPRLRWRRGPTEGSRVRVAGGGQRLRLTHSSTHGCGREGPQGHCERSAQGRGRSGRQEQRRGDGCVRRERGRGSDSLCAALMRAAIEGNNDIVDAMVKAGADVNVKDTDGTTGACGGEGQRRRLTQNSADVRSEGWPQGHCGRSAQDHGGCGRQEQVGRHGCVRRERGGGSD